MQYRNLGRSGLKVSAIGLGTNQFGGKADEKEVQRIIDAAIDAGINFIDTANTYQKGNSEIAIGKAIKGKRDKVLIATKVYNRVGDGPNERGLSRKHIMDSIEASLGRLDVDYIDLYQMHRWDEETPIDESLRAMDDLITQGKVRYIGSSAFASWKIALSLGYSELRGWNSFVSEQPHYHMLERKVEDEVIPACQYLNIGVLPFFPLAGGFLTGKYKRGQVAPEGSRGETSEYVQRYMTDENYKIVEKLAAFAAERGHTMPELAHTWLLAQPQVASVISGATKVEHIQDKVDAAEWDLSDEDLGEIEGILRPKEE